MKTTYYVRIGVWALLLPALLLFLQGGMVSAGLAFINPTSEETGSLVGIITNGSNGQRLDGALVTVDGQQITTNSNGYYRFDDVKVGWQTVTVSQPGFLPGQGAREVVGGQTRWNSIALEPGELTTATPTPTPSPSPTPSPAASPTPSPTTPLAEVGNLIGLVLHADTQERLANVEVSALGQTVVTNQNGVYLLSNLPVGSVAVTARYPGFVPTTKFGTVIVNTTRWNSMWLDILLTTPTPTGFPSPTPAPVDTATPVFTVAPLPPETPLPTPVTDPSPTPTEIPSDTLTPTPTETMTPVLPTTTPTDLPPATPTASATSTPAIETGTLAGIIRNSRNGDVLPDVIVSVLARETTTDEQGYYEFTGLAAGPHTVSARLEGYALAQQAGEVVVGEIRWNSFDLSPLLAGCPAQSTAQFQRIPVVAAAGQPRPDYLHGDLNLSQRGYSATTAPLSLRSYAGTTDPDAPQLAGLFQPNNFPGFSSVYRVNHWDWACGQHGCQGPVITDWPVTLAAVQTNPGQAINIPNRISQIYSGGFKALVLYAEEQRITLGYTRDDSVAFGYAIHIENVCVDPNLLALYRAQVDANGFRSTGFLPALRENEPFGTALDEEILVAVRDRGAFMDPRSGKDWWQGW